GMLRKCLEWSLGLGAAELGRGGMRRAAGTADFLLVASAAKPVRIKIRIKSKSRRPGTAPERHPPAYICLHLVGIGYIRRDCGYIAAGGNEEKEVHHGEH